MNDCDPKKIIDFSKNYYEILSLDKNDFPKGKSREDKIRISKILEVAFRKKARTCHPDFGGSKDAFLDIVRARRILEDDLLRKIYNQGYFEESKIVDDITGFEIDWSKIGTYRKGTPEDTIGFSLFVKLCQNKEKFDLTPAFFPKTNEHNYVWDLVINKKNNSKVAISIVNDESEVLRLTSGDKIENSLPFKIYICIPRANVSMVRDKDMQTSPDGKIMAHASIKYISYQDIDLLETTILEEAHNYIETKIQQDLQDYREGKIKPKKLENDTQWLDSEKLKEFDKQKLSEILNLKSFVYQNKENASDFIDQLPE